MLRTALVLILPLSGCVGSFLPNRDPLPPSNLAVEFATAALDTKFAVEAQAGSIVVQDRTTTGVCHKRENRGAYLEGSVVTLWVAHTGDKSEICPAVGVVGAYRATISGIQPGTYLLRVQYLGHVDTDTHPRPELERQVQVR